MTSWARLTVASIAAVASSAMAAPMASGQPTVRPTPHAGSYTGAGISGLPADVPYTEEGIAVPRKTYVPLPPAASSGGGAVGSAAGDSGAPDPAHVPGE